MKEALNSILMASKGNVSYRSPNTYEYWPDFVDHCKTRGITHVVLPYDHTTSQICSRSKAEHFDV